MAMASGASALSLGLQWNGNPDQSASEEQVEVVQRSGAAYYRMLVSRTTVIEKGWSFYDTLFDRAAKRGLTILPYLFEGSGPFPVPGAGSQYGGWGSWVREVAQRYGQGGSFWTGKAYAKPVTTWEIWNEPNLQGNNPGGATVQPENYARFFVFTSGELRAVQPGAQVLVGGLYLGGWTEPGMESYVSALYKVSGMASAVGGVAIHPYGFTQGSQYPEFASEVINIRTVLNRRPQGSTKPLWITELGWPVGQGGEFSGRAVDATTQAELLRLSFNWTEENASNLNVQGLIWHAVSDIDVASWDFHCGLRDKDGGFRPAWYSFQGQTGAPMWPMAPPSTWALASGSNANNPNQWVYYTGANGQIWQWNWFGASWSNAQATTHAAAAGTSPTAIASGGTVGNPAQWVYYHGSDNQIWQWYWSGSGSTNGALSGGQPIAANTSPTALASGSNANNPNQWVYYTGANGQIWQWNWFGASWSNAQATTHAAAAGTSPTAIASGGTVGNPAQWVYYIGSDNQIWQWYWNGSYSSNGVLSGGEPAATNTNPAVIAAGGTANNPTQWVYYRGVDGKIWQWYWNGSTWKNGVLGS
jgi:hypothetical protein